MLMDVKVPNFLESEMASMKFKDILKIYFEEWEMIHFTTEEFIGERNRLVMLGSCGWKHKQTGKTVESPK